MLLAEVVEASARVAATPARTAKIAALADLLRRLAPDEIEPAVGFLVGEPRQGRIGVRLGHLWPSGSPPGRDDSRRARKMPRRSRSPSPISTGSSIELEGTTGSGSVGARAAHCSTPLLARASSAEMDFIADLLTGGLRQGALEGVMAEAVAKAAEVPAAVVRRACMLAGDLGHTAAIALTEGPGRASRRSGSRCSGPSSRCWRRPRPTWPTAINDLGLASVEWKLDGIRLQVHKQGDDVRIFTRNLNDITDRMPEVVAVIRGLPAEQVVLDGEGLTLTEDAAAPALPGRDEPGRAPHRASRRLRSAPTSSTASTSTARTSSTGRCSSGSPPWSGWPGRGASPAR